MGIEDDFLLEDEDDAKNDRIYQKTICLRNWRTSSRMMICITSSTWFVDYYTTSGCLDVEPDAEGYINIDQDEIVNYVVKEAANDGMGPYEADDVFFVVQGEMEYGNSLGQVDWYLPFW